jgi:hypothetical protein
VPSSATAAKRARPAFFKRPLHQPDIAGKSGAMDECPALAGVETQGSAATDPLPLWVDTASLAEGLLSFLAFLGLQGLALYAGLLAHEPTATQQAEHIFANLSFQSYSFETAVSPYHRSLEYRVRFLRSAAAAAVPPLSFLYRVDCATRAARRTELEKRIDRMSVACAPTAEFTDSVVLFRDALIWYELAELVFSIWVPNRRLLRGVQIFAIVGRTEATTFQCAFRLFYSALHIFGVYRLIVHLHLRAFLSWQVEHQLVFISAFLAILSTNPLYILYAYHPHVFFIAFDCIVSPLYHALIYVTCLGLLNVFVNRTQRYLNIFLDCAFAILAFSAEFVCLLHGLISQESHGRPSVKLFPGVARHLESTVIGIFTLGALARVVQIIARFNVLDGTKSLLYSGSTLFLVGLLFPVFVLGRLAKWATPAMESVTLLIAHNGFSLLMLFFHWPYAFDRTYDNDFATQGSTMLDSSGSDSLTAP